MHITDENKKSLLKALNKLGTAAGEVELHAETLQDVDTFRRNIKEMEDEGFVFRQRDKYPEMGGLVGLTVKGLHESQ